MTAGVTRRGVARRGPSPARRALAGLVPVVGIAAAWALALPRAVPSTFGDHGTYASVAERLLAGDRLYVDVWDNKDPLFYWLLALGRLVSPLADVVIEIGWLLLASTAVMVLARWAGASRTFAALAGYAAMPFVLTGSAFEPGMTHLPGVALTLAAMAAATRSRWVLAGILVAAVGLAKTILVPTAVVAVVVVAVRRRAWAGLARSVVAAAVVAGAALGGMALRGELSGWVGNFRLNVEYADGILAGSRYGQLAGHLLRAFPEDGRGGGVVVVAVVVAGLAWLRRSPSAAPDADPEPHLASTTLWDVTLATLLTGLAVIALTATWPHHVQGLAVPVGAALALLSARLSAPWTDTSSTERPRTVRRAVLLVLTAYLAGGAVHPYFWLEAARDVPRRVASLEATSPESVLLTQLPQVRTYARAGSNDTRASAVGLRGLHLQCPRFHQYSVDTPTHLEQTAACLGTADAVIVDDALAPVPGAAAWNAYVTRVHDLVSNGWTCLQTPSARVCLRPVTAG